MNIPCKLCEKRRARRQCPGVDGEICPQCCGSQREITIDCPASCEYLKEARFHEQPPAIAEDQLPNKDVRLSEKFLRDAEPLVFTLAVALKRAMESGGAVDFDAREALDAEIQTYRTRQSGLIYDTRAPNPYAAAIQQKLREAVEAFRKEEAEQRGMHIIRDADVLGVLVFLQRLEMRYNNGRRRGRAFRDFLAGYLPEAAAPTVLV
ncbi:MAG: hypothetical protein ABI833_16165 [Acidobacteriota bacterium]